MIVGLTSAKSVQQASSLEAQGNVDIAILKLKAV